MIRLQEQPCRVLALLLEHPGKLITRQEFREALWSEGTFVDFEHSLNTAIKKLRHALDDDPEQPRYIETIPRHGYRWIMPPALAETDSRESPEAPIGHPWRGWRARAFYVGSAVVVLAMVGVVVIRVANPPSPKAAPMHLSVTPVLTVPGQIGAAAISPDGKSVAFVLAADNGRKMTINVSVIGMETILPIVSGVGPYVYLRWTPDGKYVTFTQWGEEPGIYVVPALGGKPRKLISIHGANGGFDWVPDGASLVYADANLDELPGLLRFDLATHRSEKIQGSDGAKLPRVSPDGNWIAYSNVGPLIHVLPIDGGTAKAITSLEDSFTGGLSWMPDSDRILYASQRAGFSGLQLWQVGKTGGTPTPILVPGGSSAVLPDVSRLTGRVVYFRYQQNILNVWRLDLPSNPGQEAATRPLVSSTQLEKAGQISPDGTKIAFESESSGFAQIVVADADGRNKVQLTNFHGGQPSTPRWSPDGKTLTFALDGVYTMPAEGGVATKVKNCDWGGSWSHDGKAFYCVRHDGENYWRNEQGGARKITSEGAALGEESEDGRWFYFTKWNSEGLFRVPSEGGMETRVIDQPKARAWGYWALEDDGVYYINFKSPGPPYWLEFHEFASGKSRRVTRIPQNVPDYTAGFSIAPDRRWMMYTAELKPRELDLFTLDGLE